MLYIFSPHYKVLSSRILFISISIINHQLFIFLKGINAGYSSFVYSSIYSIISQFTLYISKNPIKCCLFPYRVFPSRILPTLLCVCALSLVIFRFWRRLRPLSTVHRPVLTSYLSNFLYIHSLLYYCLITVNDFYSLCLPTTNCYCCSCWHCYCLLLPTHITVCHII